MRLIFAICAIAVFFSFGCTSSPSTPDTRIINAVEDQLELYEIASRPKLDVDMGQFPLMMVIGHPSLTSREDSLGENAMLYVDSDGKLWLSINVCWTHTLEGRKPYMRALTGCENEEARGQRLFYLLAQSPTEEVPRLDW